MTCIRATIRAHHALSRAPLEEVRLIECETSRQVADALASLHAYCRQLLGVGTISRVEILRERLP